MDPNFSRVGEKRGHSDTDSSQRSANERSPTKKGIFSSGKTSSQSPNQSSGNESLINVPESTNYWTSDAITNSLQITLRSEEDPRSLFLIGYHRLLGKHVRHKDYMRNHFENPDFEYLAKEACLDFAFNKWEGMISYEFISDVRVEDAVMMNKELSKGFSTSAFNIFLENHKYYKTEGEEKKNIFREICKKIFIKLKAFSDQLLCVVEHKNNFSERLVQDLFIAFVKIFDLTIYDTSSSPCNAYHLSCGQDVVSEPDAVICSYKVSPEMELESKVIAVVEVKRDYSKSQVDGPADKKMKLGNTTKNIQPIAQHLNSNVMGQHIGEMLAVTQSSSFFGQNGIFGIIVLGTKVTFVSLEASKDYFDTLSVGGKTKGLRSEVNYSKECNILTKNGRMELIPVFLGMEKLMQL